ncbi:MAG: anti-sigma factor [Phycisphaerae bacterium]
MKEIPNMDEKLNSFIDGELPARQQTEVQRLVHHEEKIAQRLQQLQKCRILLSSLPIAEAPPQILENVKASFARKPQIVEQPLVFDERAGTRHLLGRRLFAAAAMLGLVGILTAVVYTIVAPETVTQGPVAVERREPAPTVDVVKPGPTIVAAPFSGRLELRTSYLPAVVAFINRAIEDNIPSDEWIASDQSNVKKPHALICGSESFNLLLAELGNIWAKLDSAALFVDTEVFGEQVVVDAVTAEQISGIVNQDDSKRRMEVAKDFAVLNNMAESLPGREILAAIDDTMVDLITPPKPVLTSNQKTVKKSPIRTEENKNIHLTITVLGGN